MNMIFLFTRTLLLFICILGQALFSQARAEQEPTVSLLIEPKQCVSMREGLDCYATVKLNWRSSVKANYCLYSDQSQQALQCWQNKQTADFHSEVVSNENVRFFITMHQEKKELASTTMRVVWVHKRKRSPVSWRVF
jgi:hypothetical protein